jgi:hypothetical protein
MNELQISSGRTGIPHWTPLGTPVARHGTRRREQIIELELRELERRRSVAPAAGGRSRHWTPVPD